MKVEKLKNRIIKYRLQGDVGEIIYYTFDLDKYELSITGEITASYKWVETPKAESFIKLMVRCDKWYLLEKLFNKIFDFEESIKSAKKYIKEYYDYEDEHTLNSVIEDIDDIDCEDVNYFINSIERILENHNLSVEHYDLYDCCEMKYAYWAEKAIDHFCEHIKPELRKELENEVTENE